MSLMKDGKLIKWSHFEAKGRRVNQDINKMHTVLRLIPMLRSDVLENAAGDETKLFTLCSLGPKRLWKMGVLGSAGWRRGFTK